jgi:hypothetical protein
MVDDLKGIFFILFSQGPVRAQTTDRPKVQKCCMCSSDTTMLQYHTSVRHVTRLGFDNLCSERILLGSSTYRYCFFVPRDIYSWRTTDDSAICISGVWSGATTRACAPIRGVNKSHGTCVSITV